MLTEARQGAQTRLVNNSGHRQADADDQGAHAKPACFRRIAALQFIATMFVMHAMVGRSSLQFKMPRQDTYVVSRAQLR